MKKKIFLQIAEWAITCAACVYLVWRLATYEDYALVAESLRAMDWRQGVALALCVALMPLNMLLEAWRWYTLMQEHISFAEAHRQVYYSKLAGLITPWRLGEYPARGLLMADEHLFGKVISMGMVGSATMTAAIVIAGVLALGLLGLQGNMGGLETLSTGNYWWTITAVMVGMIVLAIVGWLLGSRTLVLTVGSPSIDRRGKYGILCISLAQSFVRLVCWCVQLILVLYALGAISIQPSAFSLSFIYYLLVTVTPNVPIAEAGVRGAWAIFLFGTPNAALAGVLLWAVNTLLPCVMWPILRKNAK